MSLLRLERQQVKALLDIMGSDDSRPALEVANIDMYDGKPVLTVTDGYILAALALPDDFTPTSGYVTRDDIIKWYKLATNKSMFTELDVLAMLKPYTDDVAKYPKWQGLVPTDEQATDIPYISVNAEYLLRAQKLEANHGMKWQFNGTVNALVHRSREGNLYLVMPMKA